MDLEEFPQNAVRLGADAVIESLHKTLPSFTQTALLHLNSDLISKSRIEKYLGIYETSSPSYILMAGMEVCIRTVKEHGAELFDNYRHELNKFYKNGEDLKRLHVMTGRIYPKKRHLPGMILKLLYLSVTAAKAVSGCIRNYF